MARFGRAFPIPRRRVPYYASLPIFAAPSEATSIAFTAYDATVNVQANADEATSVVFTAYDATFTLTYVAPAGEATSVVFTAYNITTVTVSVTIGAATSVVFTAYDAAVTAVTTPDSVLAAAALVALTNATSIICRRVDIYEADGVTPWLEDVPTVPEGGITVTDGPGPRRTCTFTLQSDDGALLPDVTGFWFDKILKAWRGVVIPEYDDTEFLFQVFEGQVEPIAGQNFPANTVKVTGSDYAATLARAKYTTVTTFGAGQTVEAVVEQIATYGGLSKFRMEITGRYLGRGWQLETDTTLWDAIQKLCTDHGCEAFFAADGHLVVRVVTPTNEKPTAYAFTTGAAGSLVTLAKSTSAERLYNHVVVRGESSDPAVAPVYAEAENTEPGSPTRIAAIGRRTYTYVSPLITTTDQAQDVADAFLAQKAILDIEAQITALVIPTLDAGDVVSVEDPNPAPSEPAVARWQLASFPIPWTLGPVTYQARRAAKVG